MTEASSENSGNEVLGCLHPPSAAGTAPGAAPSSEIRETIPGGTFDSPFLVFAGVDWWYHNRAHSDVQLALRLAEDRRVLMVNSIGLRQPRPGRTKGFFGKILRKARSTFKYLRRPVPGLPGFHVMTPLMIPTFGIGILRRANPALIRLQVRTACRLLGIRKPAILLTVPTALEVARPLERSILIYNRSDKHSAFSEADSREIEGLERRLMQEADLVLYVNRNLMEEERTLCGGKVHYLDHGVDLEAFRPLPEDATAPELREIPRPRVGWFGKFRDLVDLELLIRTARELPEVRFVFVGPTESSLEEFASLPNVHLLGPQPHSRIPSFGAGFDAALMAWKDLDWIRHSNPIKLKEYLALGLPVLSTPLPEAERYRGPVRFADRESFPGALAALLRELEDPETRKALAARARAAVEGDTWTRRKEELCELCRLETMRKA